MEYLNILKPCDLEEKSKNIDLEIDNLNKKFCWHFIHYNDDDIRNHLKTPLFVETPLIFVHDIKKSDYNNQYFLNVSIPNNIHNTDYEHYNNVMNYIIEIFQKKIEDYIKNNNRELTYKKSIDITKLFIDMNSKPLFYISDHEILNNQITDPLFKRNITNSKIKCILKPLLWSKKENNVINFGIKYIIHQCLLSQQKHVSENFLRNEKIMSTTWIF